MRLRPLDAEGTRAYLNELRPRLLAVRIRADKVNLRWWVPAWAIEESIRFVLRLAPIALAIAPGAVRRLLGRTQVGGAYLSAAARPADLWDAIDELFSEADRDLLALPDDVPFIDVTTDDVRVYIGTVRI